MLTGKQKRFLRKQAHHVNALFQIGKHGVTPNLLNQLEDLLEKRELIKVHILQNCLEDKVEIANQIAEELQAEIVQIIGNQLIFYKQSVEYQEIVLPE